MTIPNTVVLPAVDRDLIVDRDTGRYRVVTVIGNTANGTFGFLGVADHVPFASPVASRIVATSEDILDGSEVGVTLDGKPVTRTNVIGWLGTGAIG